MQMRSLPKGKNIRSAGYDAVSGTLRVSFGKGEYDYGPGVPEEKFVKLCNSPFPDRQYTLTIKGKFTCVKVENTPEEPNGEGDSTRCSDTRGGRAENEGSGNQRTQPVAAAPSVACSGGESASQNGGRVVEVYYGEKDGVTFTEEGHAYYLKGQRVPFSLTQILELSGISRQPSSATEIAARPAAAKRGTKIHEATLLMDQDDFDLETLKPWPEYYNRCVGWQQFREDFKFMPDLTMCEVPIAVRVNGMLFAMKLDAYGVIGEMGSLALAVVEKKCTANEEDSHAIQTAGQALAFKARAEEVKSLLRRYVVYLFDKPNQANRYYRAVEHTDRNDEKVFVGAGLTNVYWRLNKGILKV